MPALFSATRKFSTRPFFSSVVFSGMRSFCAQRMRSSSERRERERKKERKRGKEEAGMESEREIGRLGGDKRPFCEDSERTHGQESHLSMTF